MTQKVGTQKLLKAAVRYDDGQPSKESVLSNPLSTLSVAQ